MSASDSTPREGESASTRAATLADELSRLRKRYDQLQREVVDGLETTLRNKDRELLAAADQMASTKAELVEAERKLREKDRELRRIRDAKDREARRTSRELEHLRTHTNALVRLLDEAMENVGLLVSSRRWRLGDTLLSLPRLLLGRRRLPTAADHLLKLRFRADDLQVEDTALEDASPKPNEGAIARRDHTEGPARVRTEQTARTPRSTVNSPRIDPGRSTGRVRPTKASILVLAWDVGHNPLGRAHLLAEALSRSYRVVLAGFQFPRYGNSVWQPLQDAPVRVVTVPGRSFPEFQGTLESLARRVDADVIVACKARLPAIQAGLMMKAYRNRPLIIDVDDYELGFFDDRRPLLDPSTASQAALLYPFEEAWTRFTENLLPAADRLLVSNAVLQGKFGGVLVPHARDEKTFQPDHLDRETARLRLELPPNGKVVMFVGTPRPHKGVLEVLAAVKQVRKDLNCRLVVVGKPPDAAFEALLRSRGADALELIADQPFHRLPEILAAADLVCVLQHAENEIANYQFPAKVVDAMAMQVPVLATDVPPLRDLIEDGVIDAVTPESLPSRIEWWLQAPDAERSRRIQHARTVFLERYSHDAINRTLVGVIEDCLRAPTPLPAPAIEFLEAQQRRYARSAANQAGLDLVMFWRQDDAGLYGRRFDMLVDRLARRPDIRRIAVFDPPYAAHRLWDPQDDGPTSHTREILDSKLTRRWGLADTDKVSHHVFLFDKFGNLPHGDYPNEDGFAGFVAEELERSGINPKESVFWYYPVFEELEALTDRFRPRLTVVDVVDDQRAWPGRSSQRRESMDRHYRALLGDADVVLANCESVRETLSVYAGDIVVVPNGCDLDPIPEDPQDRRFARFAAIEGPILGLAGNLEPKTDAVLLERIACERPDCHLVLVGSTHSNPSLLRLDAYNNVFFAGVVRYPEVKAWIKRFDVALLPHLATEQTRSMHPLKLLVYASLGVRIVATGVSNLGELEPFIDVARDHDAFLAAIDTALVGAGGPNRGALAETVETSSWERRVETIMQLVKAKLAQRPPLTQ